MAVSEFGSGKTVVLASADVSLRQRLAVSLGAMRWNVRQASGGAEAMAFLEEAKPEAMLVDAWLPDLEASEFVGQICLLYPGIDLLRVDGDVVAGGTRSPRRHELLHALREAGESGGGFDGVAWAGAPVAVPQVQGIGNREQGTGMVVVVQDDLPNLVLPDIGGGIEAGLSAAAAKSAAFGRDDRFMEGRECESEVRANGVAAGASSIASVLIAEMVGTSAKMVELARLIRLVAPRSATVLIEGETGSGKEVVAQAVHRLSARAAKPFAVLNCAAIPESLLEAELFGHTRGAFTGAVTSRTGRIEAAHGGTLFLDEIGEMPLALQAKMLRFLECGELQRVGDNDVVRVDVRVIAATHQQLEKRADEGTFRLDLFHRLEVFPVEVPALRERLSDVPALVEFFLAKMGEGSPRKRISAEAMACLQEHSWPGNVRELAHVLERAAILCGEAMEIGVGDVRFRRATR